MIQTENKLTGTEITSKNDRVHSIIERYLKCRNWECKFNLRCDKKVVLHTHRDMNFWLSIFREIGFKYLLVRLLYLVVFLFNFMLALKTKFSHTFASHLPIYIYIYVSLPNVFHVHGPQLHRKKFLAYDFISIVWHETAQKFNRKAYAAKVASQVLWEYKFVPCFWRHL